jgi:CrcB protein
MFARRGRVQTSAGVMKQFAPYLLVGVGGFLGANLRFLVARWVGAIATTRFPLGTFVINISGCFLLGILGSVAASRLSPAGDELRLALGVGFLGAFTTFSTFEFESHALFEDGAWGIAVANITLSVLLGLVAVRLGVLVVRTWWP